MRGVTHSLNSQTATKYKYFFWDTVYMQYTVSPKNCAKLFLSERCQISTNCINFWHKYDKVDKLT